MVKKITTVSIDEDVLRLAKKEIPNLSIFMEDVLKSYLGFKNTNIKSIDENLQTIKDCLLNIELMSKQGVEADKNETFNSAEQQKAWNNLFGLYRNGANIEPEQWEHTSKLLKIDVISLKGLLSHIDLNLNREEIYKCNEWSYAKTIIGQ